MQVPIHSCSVVRLVASLPRFSRLCTVRRLNCRRFSMGTPRGQKLARGKHHVYIRSRMPAPSSASFFSHFSRLPCLPSPVAFYFASVNAAVRKMAF
ncbi:hypothetical protein PUN28_005073 [Cardiocondyla obscurior]|uniref:Uncharacterized protein n=1 Tax=Cardiocondyla obscurior TaxID=286306 RepID=A0AAW2GH32_9HYME